MELNILFVEDDPEDFEQISREIELYFEELGVEAKLDKKAGFQEGFEAASETCTRYDLVISDTYRGEHRNRDAAVLQTVERYRQGRFTPVVVCSSGERPADLHTSVFVNWADKSVPGDIVRAIGEIIETGVPQLAKNLHDEIDNAAGSYLWEFLEKNWEKLKSSIDKDHLERVIRRRAALKISDLIPGDERYTAVKDRYGLEYYIYPSLGSDYFNLGDIIRRKDGENDIRVILTPHCHLFTHAGQQQPRAEYVLTVKTVMAADVLGDKIKNAKEKDLDKQNKTLARWARSPAQTERKPEGRHWYLPKFMDIPHLFCDFLQVESVDYASLREGYERIATLTPPYAEALQECFSGFYGSVGIPDIVPESIKDLLE